MHGFRVWLKWKSPTSRVMARWTKQCRQEGRQLRAAIFKQLWSQRNHVCDCSVRSPSTAGCALSWYSPSAHPSSSLAISPSVGWGDHAQMLWAICFTPVISEGFMILGAYGFIFTSPGAHGKGKLDSCFGFCDIFVFKFKFPKRTLALPGPKAEPNPTVDDLYLTAWKGVRRVPVKASPLSHQQTVQ